MSQTICVSSGEAADSRDLEPLCAELLGFLTRAKALVDDEIRTYPTPIPRCDAQFNYLIEQRSRLARMLAQAHAAWEREGDGSLRTLCEFTASEPFTEDATEQALRQRIAAALPAQNVAADSASTRTA